MELIGYLENPEIITISDFSTDLYSRSKIIDSLSPYQIFWLPIQRPETWFKIIFDLTLKVVDMPIYKSKEECYNS